MHNNFQKWSSVIKQELWKIDFVQVEIGVARDYTLSSRQ